MKHLKPRFASYNNNAWQIICEDFSNRTVTLGQFQKEYGDLKSYTVDYGEGETVVGFPEWIDYLNSIMGRTELLCRLEVIINIEQARNEKVAEIMAGRGYNEEDLTTDYRQDPNIFGVGDSEEYIAEDSPQDLPDIFRQLGEMFKPHLNNEDIISTDQQAAA